MPTQQAFRIRFANAPKDRPSSNDYSSCAGRPATQIRPGRECAVPTDPLSDLLADLLTEAEARALYQSDDATHDFDHVLRVARMALRIAEAEGANTKIVWLAALLHDLPVSHDTDEDARLAHHLRAAEAARTLLLARGMRAECVEQVVHAIRAHRFRDRSVPPTTLEAKILFDADKLDSMGAIGIGRAFAYAGGNGSRLYVESVAAVEMREKAPAPSDYTLADYTPVHEYVYKLRKLLATLYTDSARELGRERHSFMEAFFNRLDAEMIEAVAEEAQAE